MEVDVKNKNGPPLPLLSCELSVPVRGNLDKKNMLLTTKILKQLLCSSQIDFRHQSNNPQKRYRSEAYSEHSQTAKMEPSAKIIDCPSFRKLNKEIDKDSASMKICIMFLLFLILESCIWKCSDTKEKGFSSNTLGKKIISKYQIKILKYQLC